MSKDKISDYSATANSNTDIGGINIDEGCAPSGINDAIRTLMKQLKDWQSGSQDVYIHPAGSASVPSITATGDTNTGLFFPAADTVGITTGGTERARVDSSGNLGLGVTPSAWRSTYKALQSNGGSFYGFTSNDRVGVSQNAYVDATSFQWTYTTTAAATNYLQIGGEHQWYRAASGTAGNSISFTQAMTLDASGNLGVGTTSPTSGFRLDIQAVTARQRIESTTGTNEVQQRLTNTGGTLYCAIDNSTGTGFGAAYGAVLWHNGNYPMLFGTNNTERMRIDSSGNLGIGTTSPGAKLDVSGTAVNFSNSSGTFDLRLYQTGRYDGRVTVNSSGMEISQRQALPLLFLTSDIERARIDSSGNLLINTTSLIDSAYKVNLYFASGGGITIKTGTNGDNAMGFRNAAGTTVGGIVINSSTTAYNTSSDYRLKENIAPMTGALATVNALKPVTYTWKADGSDGQGFIAHELQAVLPEAVTGEKDAVDEDGNPKYQGIDTSFLVATLTAALQEAHGLIKDLQTRVAALES